MTWTSEPHQTENKLDKPVRALNQSYRTKNERFFPNENFDQAQGLRLIIY